MESDITNVYNLVAAVYRAALRDAQSRDERKREAAVAWLDTCCPDWRDRVGGANLYSFRDVDRLVSKDYAPAN